MLKILYRRPWAVKLRSISTSAIAAGPKTRKKKDVVAFPPRYQNHINTWSQLIQLEIDECQQPGSEPNVLLSNLVFKSYSVDPMKGHTVEFGFADDEFLSDKDLRSPMPVTLLEKFGRVRKYGCILLEKRSDGLKLKLRGAFGNQFDPSIADEAKYSIVPSEDVGTMQVVKEFLDLRAKWDKLPGYPVFQTVYRAKPLKSVYVDRKLKFFQDLNERQSAVCAAMNSQRPIVCIQGPPGTGKTHVLAEIILQANRAKQSVLICAPSHQAVNNIMKRVSHHISGAYQKWSSETFYNSKLRPVESVKDIRLSDANEVFNHDVFGPLVLIDTDLYGANSPTHETSYFKIYQNRVKAKIVAEHFRKLAYLGLPPNDLGIITPYLGQVHLLRNLLKDTEAAINSVDAFQGDQREAILMSLIRNNFNNYVRFLSDFCRMNCFNS